MNFSGTLDASSGMTMTRLIERIVHTDTPGELRLHDESSGRRATVAIRRGMVTDVAFGELTGDPALTAISQATPWTFEFAPDEAGAAVSHPGIISRRPRARAVVRTAPVPAPAPAPGPDISEAVVPDTSSPAAPDPLAPWLVSPAVSTARFAAGPDTFSGAVEQEDYDYFRSDCQFLRSTAAGIARSLGVDAPLIFAICEDARATGYHVLPDGFLGVIGGAGTGVSHVLDFPDSAPWPGSLLRPAIPPDIPLLESLAALPGVTGLFHHLGDYIGWHRQPASISLDRSTAFCAAIAAAFAGYAAAGRILREAWFEFPDLAVFVITIPDNDPSAAPEEFLTFIVRDRAAAAAVTDAAAKKAAAR